MKNKFILACLLAVFNLPLFAETVYLDPPKDFRKHIEVAACFYEYDGKVLFLLRNPNKPQGSTWGIPGGKIDKGETPKQAVVREFYEETGLTLDSDHLQYADKVYITSEKVDLVFHVFKLQTQEKPGDVKLSPPEHVGYSWVTLDKALQMPLIPGEEECIHYFYPETAMG